LPRKTWRSATDHRATLDVLIVDRDCCHIDVSCLGV
jgi:hypothetical protein